MKIFNEIKQTIAAPSDITIQNLHIRIRAKRVSALMTARRKDRFQDIIETAMCSHIN